jgi:hypothetical protein
MVSACFNAVDRDEVVALHASQPSRFAVTDPGIGNYTGMDDRASWRHGISGYRGDAEVAGPIHRVLRWPAPQRVGSEPST